MSDWTDFEPLTPQKKRKEEPQEVIIPAEFEPLGMGDLPPESQEMLKIYKDPKVVLESMQAGIAISSLTGMDARVAADHFEPISETLYGKKLPAAGIIKRIGNTLKAAQLNHEIARRSVNQFLGLSTPGNDQKIKELQTQLPSPEEQLKSVPNAALQFLYEYGYEVPKTAIIGRPDVETRLGREVEKLTGANAAIVSKITSVVASVFAVGPGIVPIGGGRVLREITEQSIGTHYRALLDAGINENTARVVTGVLSGIDTALNAIPMGRAGAAGTRFTSKLAAQGVSRALLKGTVARIALEAGEQAAFAVAQSTAIVVATEIAKAVHNQTVEEKLPMKRADEILKQIGIEAIPQAVMGTVIAGVSVAGVTAYQFSKGSPADAAVQAAVDGKPLLRRAQAGEILPSKLEIEGKPRTEVPTAPNERVIGTILDITDAQAAQLDASVKSAESSADYVPPPGMTRREIIAEYRQTLEDRKVVNKLVRDIKKIDTTEMRDEYAEPVQRILEDFTATNMREKTVERLQKIQTDLDIDPNVEISIQDRKRLGELGKIPLAKLSVDDLTLVHDSLMHYAKLARDAHRIKVSGEYVDRTLIVNQALVELPDTASIRQKVVSTQPSIGKELATGVRKAKDFFGPMQDHLDLLIERLGPMAKKVIFDDVHAGNLLKEKYAQDRTTDFQTTTAPLWEKYKPNRWLNEYQAFSEVLTPEGIRVPLKLSRAERMALYMHAQDPQNVRHILDGGIGFKWREGERNRVYHIDSDMLAAVVNGLSEDERVYVQAAQEMFRRNGADLDKVYYDLNDIHLVLRENYYPIDTMPVGRGKEAESAMSFDLARQEWARVGLFKGMTERRVDSKIPIYLNPITYDLQKAMDHTSTYIGLESPLRNASRLLYAKDFKNSVQTKLGNDYWRFVEKGLKDIAGQRENYGMLENTALSLRNRLATATLGVNPFPILLQPVSIIRYSQYVKMRYLMAGITDSIMHPKVVSQTHRLWSPEFVARTGKGFSREVADVIKQGSFGQAFGQGEKIRSKLMKGLQAGDATAVVAGMEGAVRQTLDEFRAGKLSPEVKKALQIENAIIAGLSPEQKMSLAYKFADYVTERTQAMGLPEFQSTMQRGSAFQKMFTLFGSEASASMNMRRRAYFEAKKAGTPQAWAKYAKVLTLTLIVEPMFIVIRDRLRTAAKSDKQEDIGKDIAEALINAPFEGLPVVRDVVRTAARKTFDKSTGSGSILPLQRIADVATKAIVGMSDIATAKSKYARKKAALKTADATAEFVSLWTGMPYRPVMNLGEMGLRVVKELRK